MSDEEKPVLKRSRMENNQRSSFITFSVVERLLSTRFQAFAERIDALTTTVMQLVDDTHRHSCCEEVLHKLSIIEEMLRPEQVSPSMMHDEINEYDNEDSSNLALTQMLHSSIPVVLVNNQKPNQVSASLGLDSTVHVVTLNSEKDFEAGSWLGDETNGDTRVRCPISPANLTHINTTCTTPEKMAIKLLDYLFPREILAVSNLSGKGKHGKQQLNPLMIYGIRCHLMHKFDITEGHWFRIKQNIDSKCRTAWRKKTQGIPFGRNKKNALVDNIDTILEENQLHQIIAEDGESIFVTSEPFLDQQSDEDLEIKMLHMPDGDVKVVHATPEQLLRLQQRHHYRVLSNDQLLPVLEESHVLCEDDGVIDGSQPMLAIVTSEVDDGVDSGGMGELEYVDIGAGHPMVDEEDLQLIQDNVEEMEVSNLITDD